MGMGGGKEENTEIFVNKISGIFLRNAIAAELIHPIMDPGREEEGWEEPGGRNEWGGNF